MQELTVGMEATVTAQASSTGPDYAQRIEATAAQPNGPPGPGPGPGP